MVIDGLPFRVIPVLDELKSLLSDAHLRKQVQGGELQEWLTSPAHSHPHTSLPRHPYQPNPSMRRRREVRDSCAAGGALALTLVRVLFRPTSMTRTASRKA
jgi:hypothetical protein